MNILHYTLNNLNESGTQQRNLHCILVHTVLTVINFWAKLYPVYRGNIGNKITCNMKTEYKTNTNHLFSKCLLNLIIKIQSCKKQSFVHACFEHALIKTKITKHSSHYSIFGMLFKQHKFINTWGTEYNIISQSTSNLCSTVSIKPPQRTLNNPY